MMRILQILIQNRNTGSRNTCRIGKLNLKLAYCEASSKRSVNCQRNAIKKCGKIINKCTLHKPYSLYLFNCFKECRPVKRNDSSVPSRPNPNVKTTSPGTKHFFEDLSVSVAINQSCELLWSSII